MKRQALEVMRCPACRSELKVEGSSQDVVEDGELICGGCARVWPVERGIPQLVFPEELQDDDLRSRRLWDRMAPLWGVILGATNLLRGTLGPREPANLIEQLELGPGATVLETAAGGGRNLRLIAQHAGDVSLFGLDLSPRMLARASRNLRSLSRPPELVLGNSTSLPFADDAFDALLDGFGMKYYSDKARAIGEMVRVVKPGGKVVIGELGLPAAEPRTFRQRLLLLWIPGFGEPPPTEMVPDDVEGLTLDWDQHKTVYTIQFRKPAP